METIKYDQDIVAWASQQAEFLRAGRFDLLDLKNIADEVEDVGRSEKRELLSRMAELMAHLLKWHFQPERRGASWETSIRKQRKGIARALEETPSLKAELASERWQQNAWDEAVKRAADQTDIGYFPESCPWTMAQVRDEDWFPS